MMRKTDARTTADPFQLKGRVFGSLVGVFLVFVITRAGVLWWQHDQTLAAEQKRAENLVLVLSEHLDRTFGAIESALNQIAAHSESIGGPAAPREVWAPVLNATLSGLSGVGSLNLIDAEGTITLSTDPVFTGTSRRNFYLYQRLKDEPGGALVIGPPTPSVSVDRFFIPVGRTLRGKDGRFIGLTAATFHPEGLRSFYQSVDIGPHGVIRLLDGDGRTFFSQPRPARSESAGGAARTEPNATRNDAGFGFTRAQLQRGGESFLTAWRTNARSPVVVAVSIAERDALASWRTETIIVGGGAAGMALMLAIAGLWITASSRAYARTVGERNRADAALRASQVRFQAIMDHTPFLVLVKDLDGRYTFVNRAAEQWAAATGKSSIGKTVWDIMSPDAAQRAEAVDREVIATRAPIQHEWTFATPIGKRTMWLAKFPLIDDAGTPWGLGVISMDVTDQKHAEAQLAHAQRMEAVGQLTGGIAHDFNNMLTAILLNADLLANQIQSDTLRPLAEAMRAAAERGADLTKRLLAFGRRQTLMPRATDVNELLSGMEPLMQRTLGEHIDIRFRRGERIWAATVDAGQLENAIVNLAVNARDAMPDGGTVAIEVGEARVADGDRAPGLYTVIEVADTGVGMDEETRARLFEPFFTTKPAGQGTGMGMAIVYRLVERCGGFLHVDSEPGRGTRIRAYLPRVAAEG